jgi:hypothetical protein
MTEDDRAKKIALAEYKEVVTQFRILTDIRFKLLTYLPLGTVAAAVFAQRTDDLMKQPAIPAFAFVVTLCMATYDKRNDQHYDELVARAGELERELHIEHGSFSYRPKPWLKYGFVSVEHRWPIGLIYAAAASLWAYLFAAALVKPDLIWLKFAAPAAVIACWLGLRFLEHAHSEEQKAVVRCLMEQLLGPYVPPVTDDSPGKLAEKIATEPILGIAKDEAERRVNHHWKGSEQKRDSRAASALLGAVIDLPPRWIEDVWSGRR